MLTVQSFGLQVFSSENGMRGESALKEHKFLNTYQLKLAALIGCLLLIVLVIFLFGLHTYRLPVFDGVSKFNEPGWYFGEQGGEMSPVKLSDQHMIEPGKRYILSTTLVYSGEGDDYPCAFFTVGNYQVRVYLDSELMFQYTLAERGLPKLLGMGGAAFSVPLGENCQGKELRVELETSMDYALERRMPGIMLGDYATRTRQLFLSNVPSILISMAIFFVAVILVILGNADTRKRWAYLFFSVFALIIVIYRSSQDLYLMYVWANPILSVTLEFFSLVVCPLPVMLSYRFEMKPYFQKTFAVLIGITVLNIFTQLVLHFTGIRDVVQNLTVTHLWIVVCMAALIVMDLKVHKLDPEIHCMRKLIPILAGAILDFIAFYVLSHIIGPGSFFVVGNFIGLGLLTSLCMMVWEARKARERSYAEAERAKLLEKVAYVDALTGIENRAAFTRVIGEIQAGIYNGQSVLAVEADLNDLKKVNDNMGHAAGDDLIRRAASVLHDCFHDYGHVYRTGGDEFFALFFGVTESQWEDLRQQFLQELKRRNAEQSLPLSIAVGHAFMEDSIEHCIQKADRQMYRNKNEIKNADEIQYGFCSC